MKIVAILLAAGVGSRMGSSVPKQLLKIKGREVILRSLEIFTASSIDFDAVIVAATPPEIFKFDWKSFLLSEMPADKNRIHLLSGGVLRQDSVYNALNYIEKVFSCDERDNMIVFIHDSARPFVKERELKILLEEAFVHGASFLCSPVTETIKVKKDAPEDNKEPANNDKGLIFKTLKRDLLVAAKTPQVFRFDIIKKAMEHAKETGFQSTDDVSLLEDLGFKAVPVLSSEFNIKITSPSDIEIAELFCEKFAEGRY